MTNQAIYVVKPEPDERGRIHWIQFAIVSDERVEWLECVPALLSGWNVRSRWVHDGDSWKGYSAEQIVRFKQASELFGVKFLPADEKDARMVRAYLAREGSSEARSA